MRQDEVRGIPTWIFWLVLMLLSAASFVMPAHSQTNSGPILSPRYDTWYYPGVSPYVGTIQSAATAACAATAFNHMGIVALLPGLVWTDTPTTVTGCAGVQLVDFRTLPWSCYASSGGLYVASSCGSGGGGAPTAILLATPFSAGCNFIPTSDSTAGRAAAATHFCLDDVNGILSYIAGRGLSYASPGPPVITGTLGTTVTPGSAVTCGSFTFATVTTTPFASIETFDATKNVPVLLGSPFVTPVTAAFGLTCIPKVGATDGSGYLAVGYPPGNELAILNYSGAGVVTAGTLVTGIPSANIFGSPYDPINHLLYVTQKNNGAYTPVDVTSPLSPIAWASVSTPVSGGTMINPLIYAPGNGFVYLSVGTDVSHQSFAQVFTMGSLSTPGVAVGTPLSLLHAPQRMLGRGNFTFTAEHDSQDIEIADFSNPAAPAIAKTLSVGCGIQEMTTDEIYLFVSCDGGGNMVKINVDDPYSAFVVSTTTGYTGFSAALAVSSHYLFGGSGTNAVNTDIGGFYSAVARYDQAEIRKLAAISFYAKSVRAETLTTTNPATLGQGSTSGRSLICTVAPVAGCANTVNPMAGVGDMIRGGSAGAPTNLAAPTVAGTYMVTETPAGTAVAPLWLLAPISNTCAASQWFNAFASSTGVFTCTQPTFADIASGSTAATLTCLSGCTIAPTGTAVIAATKFVGNAAPNGTTATTQAVNDNSGRLATTVYVTNQAATATPIVDGTGAVGTSQLYARQDHVHPTDTSRAASNASTTVHGATCTLGSACLATFPLSCQPGLGDGLNAVPAGTYPQTIVTLCKNDTGGTWTLTGILCASDNSGSSTCAATNGAGTSLITGTCTATSAGATCTQSATVTIVSGDEVKTTFVSDGVSKQIGIDVKGTY